MLSRDEMICRQKEEDELNIIRGKVEKGINTKFVIIEDVLFANRWGNEACKKIMIPRSLIFQISRNTRWMWSPRYRNGNT